MDRNRWRRQRSVSQMNVAGPLAVCLAMMLYGQAQAQPPVPREWVRHWLDSHLSSFMMSSTYVHAVALHRLDLLGPGEALRFAKGLRSADRDVRRSSAFALQVLGPDARAATPFLEEAALNQDDTVLAEHAVIALGRIGAGARDSEECLLQIASENRDVHVTSIALVALGRIGADSDPTRRTLIEALQHVDGGIRVAAAEALGMLQAKEAAFEISQLFDDASPWVRLVAARNLWILTKSERALEELVVISTDAGMDASFRLNALQALAEIGPEAYRADVNIRELVDDQEPTIRIGARCALWKMGEGMNPAEQCAAMVRSKNPEDRSAGLGGFKILGRDATPHLTLLLEMMPALYPPNMDDPDNIANALIAGEAMDLAYALDKEALLKAFDELEGRRTE